MAKQRAPGWGAQWLAALAAAWGARLKRGAAYAREGQVTDLRVQPGQATAVVPDPAGERWAPRLAVRPLSASEWAAAATAILRDPVLAAALDVGEWPPALAPALAAAGSALLPTAADLAADCPCGERVPCRHVAALAQALAAALERDPWLLPLLRGRSRPALAATLAAARAALVPGESPAEAGAPPFAPGGAKSATVGQGSAPGPSGEQGPAVVGQGSAAVGQGSAPGPSGEQDSAAVGQGSAPGPSPTGFWDLNADLLAIHLEIAAPAQPAPMLRQLGPPPFWRPPAAFADHLEPVYAAVTAAILHLAWGDDEVD